MRKYSTKSSRSEAALFSTSNLKVELAEAFEFGDFSSALTSTCSLLSSFK